MKLTFDYYHNLERVDLYLCNPDGRELFPLPGRSRNLTLRFNDLSELTFEVDSKATLSNGDIVTLEAYDYIQSKRLVYATNVGWFQITTVDEHNDGVSKYKSVTTESLQSVLKNKGFISEERVYCFYNPDDPYDDQYDSLDYDSIPSVLGQWKKQLGIEQDLAQGVSEPDAPYNDWTVTYVSPSLVYSGSGSKCRTFKENVTYGYDWMVNDVEEAFEVIVLFDFMHKTIHVMTPDEVAQKVNVIYTFNNFMKGIDVSEASEDIVTVLNCNGDNCDITAVNPTGTNYICDFSYFMDKVNHRWMSSELIAKLEAWQADCKASKEPYENHIKNLRALYQEATEKKTKLQEMSLSLTDLRTAQSKRLVPENAEQQGSLCGIVTAENVKTYRTTNDEGEEIVVGGNSIKEGTDYFSVEFSGATNVTAYQSAPRYNKEMRRWEWDSAGSSMSGTADSIIEYNMSDDNASGLSYWYFSDVNDGSSYCKLQSAAKVNKQDATSKYYCGGFDRYIAYTYPITDEESGVTEYTDTVQEWINLREGHVATLNTDLYGHSLSLNGYQRDDSESVVTENGKVYLTTVTGGRAEPTPDSTYGRINALNETVGSISSRLNILAYFANTPGLLRELNCYWIEGDYTSEHIAVLEDTTPEDEIDLSNELLAAGYAELSKVCQPRLSFSVESIDATKQYEFKDQMRLLELGKIVTIEKEEGVWYYPALLEISMSLDDSEEFSMVFANATRLDDWGYTYADLISDASSTSRQVSASWQDITAYTKDRESISSIIRDPLDATLRAGSANMVNQDFIIDKDGILGRKRVSETSSEFEKEQVRLINNLLIFTDDNWETAKTALGKIRYEDDTGKQVTSYGLIAETIIGELIMGKTLKIKNANSSVVIDGAGISIIKKVANADGSVTETPVFTATPDGEIYVSSYATNGDLTNALQSYVTSSSATATFAKITDGSTSTFGYTLDATHFAMSANGITVMDVTSSGLSIKGEVDAIKGKIGGWDISEDGITKGSTGILAGYSHVKQSLLSKYESTIRFFSGGSSSNPANGTFVVLADGSLYASAAKIEGEVIADKGAIGGWAIDEDGITSGAAGIIAGDNFLKESLVGDYKSAVRFFGGSDDRVNGTFVVLDDGSLYASAVKITGGSIEMPDDSDKTVKLGVGGGLQVFDMTALGTDGEKYYACAQYSANVLRYGRSTSYGGSITNTNEFIYNAYGGNPYVMLIGSWVGNSSGSIVSDATLKSNIDFLDARYDLFFDKIAARRFKYIDGTSSRFHTGYISQEIQSALAEAGIAEQEFAAICTFEDGQGFNFSGLRYEEFISLNTWQIQKLKARVAKLEEIIAKLAEN